MAPNCEVKIFLDIAPIEKLIYNVEQSEIRNSVDINGFGGSEHNDSFRAFAGYFYLDENERNIFMKNNVLDYLVETVEMNLNNSVYVDEHSNNSRLTNTSMTVGPNGNLLSLNLNFTGMSRYLLWTINGFARKANKGCTQNSKTPWYVPGKSATMRFNNQDRMPMMPWRYFTELTKYYYGCSDNNLGNNSYSALYNFGTESNSKDPSGSCNFGRLSHKSLEIETGNLKEQAEKVWKVNKNDSFEEVEVSNDFNINVYSVRYNVLRVSNGQVALAFD